MKFTTVFAVLATVATAVSATFTPNNGLTEVTKRTPLTNAQRLARGLALNPPVRRHGHGATPTYGAPKHSPSGISNSCNTGPIQCCNSVTSANPKVKSLVQSLVGLVVAPDVAVGLTCSPLSVIGLGKNSCTSQPVCCENNSFNGLVAIGCSPININLV